MTPPTDHSPGPPPSFEAATSRRQKARSAGLDPNYWYAVEESSRLKKGQVIETKFLGQSIAVFRGKDGRVRAVENRCAHRHIKLSKGEVVDCRLVCPYHGWQYEGDGRAHIPHDLFGKKAPDIRIRSIPIRERYGLIFLFPGDPELSTVRDIPAIPELEGSKPWPHAFVQFDCPGHHSMLLENVSDFTHGFLHRKFQPFYGTELLRCEEIGDRVELEYKSKIAAGRFQDMFINRSGADCDHMLACYDYPYHWSSTDDRIKHFLFTFPIDEQNNRHIFIFYLRPDVIRLPLLNRSLPRWIADKMMKMTRYVTLEPLLGQDVWVIEHEQDGWNRHWDRPEPEISPVVRAFQDLTIRKWEEYLASQQPAKRTRRGKRVEGLEVAPSEARP